VAKMPCNIRLGIGNSGSFNFVAAALRAAAASLRMTGYGYFHP